MNRSLAPLGADRFYDLIQEGFYNDSALFRVVPGFVLQFGISGSLEGNQNNSDITALRNRQTPNQTCQLTTGNSSLNEKWLHSKIKDDPVVGSNTRGTISYATDGPDTRTAQVKTNCTTVRQNR